jgi:PAS domain S-box-containing protein
MSPEVGAGGIRLSADLLRQVIEASPTAMMMVDDEGRLLLVNAQVERLFDFRREELVGRPVEILVPARYRLRHPHFRAEFFVEPRARPMGAGRDLYGLRKDGIEVPIEIGLNPVSTSEGMFVVASIVDITERKRAAEQLQASLREKETLLKEVHHRVKNNLQVISSLLSLQARQMTDAQSSIMLQESQSRVHSISLVHEKLYQAGDLARIDFGEYLEALAMHLVGTWSAEVAHISVRVRAIGIQLPVDVAIPCGLIVNELVTNALRHAFPDGRKGSVEVSVSREADCRLLLVVQDDGLGLSDGFELRRPGSLGLELVATLARQIRAELEIVRGGGTAVRLKFEVER